VILAIPAGALFNQNLIVTVLVTAAGLTGMLLARKSLAAMASIGLLALIVWGKVASSILRTGSPDTAVFVIEFTTVIVLLEASSVVIAFNKNISRLKPDQHALLQTWLWNQLKNQGKLGLVALGLSIVLLPVAGLTSIPSNQLVLSATLALLAVVVLLFLITHGREPAEEE